VTDRIELRGLRLLGHHGALPGEQARAQPFEVDLDVETDANAAARSDDLADALDYGGLVAIAADVVTNRRYRLIESIASAICDDLLVRPGVCSVTVSVRKLRPPVPFDLVSAGIRISRTRS
jgi:dihydroneopterin aldolase